MEKSDLEFTYEKSKKLWHEYEIAKTEDYKNHIKRELDKLEREKENEKTWKK